MKKLLLLLLILKFQQGFSQENERKPMEFDVFYNWSMVGKNISLIVNKPFSNHLISIGIKYHDNHRITDNRGYAYKDRFREDGMNEALGFNLGYRFDFRKNNQTVNPYLFYLLQVSHLRLIQDYTNDPWYMIKKVSDPFIIFEHSLGIGLQTKIFNNFYLNQSAGLGIAHFHNKRDKSLDGERDGVSLLRIGCTYKFN